MAKIKGKGIAWSEQEQRLLWALKEVGARTGQLPELFNKQFANVKGYKRTPSSVSNALVAFRTVKKSITDEDRTAARMLLSGGKVTLLVPVKRVRRSKGELATVAPETLSLAARKSLEAKLIIHRFKLETPDSSIEVSVSGKSSDVVFKKIVGVITVFGK